MRQPNPPSEPEPPTRTPLGQQIERSVHLAAHHELDLGTTWGAPRVRAFAERIARHAADLLTRGDTCPVLTSDRVRAVVHEVASEEFLRWEVRHLAAKGAAVDSLLEAVATRAAGRLAGRWAVAGAEPDAASVVDGPGIADLVERELLETAERAEVVDDRPPYDAAFARRVAHRVAARLVDRGAVAVVSAWEVRSMVHAAVMAGTPDGASSLAVLERTLDADAVAARVSTGLAGRSTSHGTTTLDDAERAILRRLRDNEARARSSLGHLGEDVRQQCDAAVALLDRLIGVEAP